jgi:hypothetical protein
MTNYTTSSLYMSIPAQGAINYYPKKCNLLHSLFLCSLVYDLAYSAFAEKKYSAFQLNL